jgi:hypothetical protein
MHALPIDADAERERGGEGFRLGRDTRRVAAVPMHQVRDEGGEDRGVAAGVILRKREKLWKRATVPLAQGITGDSQ